ncbi:uncharacterized protein LOC144912493 [Branchiostoma floridae x Branchiostoma belcheri]
MWNSMRPYSPYWIVLLAAWHSAFIIAVCTADKQDLDHYEILGVPRNAKSADIKRAFRRLAAEHHPDKNKDPGAEARFTEIVEAYEVLTDEQLRAVYDKDGHSGVKKFKREGQASSESQRFRKRQFDIQIEEIIAELLMLFKFAKKANGPWGPNSQPFVIFSPKDADFPFRFNEPWHLPTRRKENREKYNKMGEEYPGRERARTYFRQMYSEEANGSPNHEQPIFPHQKKLNENARPNMENILQFTTGPRTFSKKYHNDNASPFTRRNAYENKQGKHGADWTFKPPGKKQGGDDFPGGASRIHERKFYMHNNHGREKSRKGTDLPDVKGFVPTSRLPTGHNRQQTKDRRTFIRDSLSKGKQRE